MSKSLFFIYLKGIYKNTKNVFSAISFAILILTFFLNIPTSIRTSIQGIVLLASFFWASFKFWAETYKTEHKNEQGELIFNLVDSNMGSSVWRSGMPSSPSLYFDFDVINTNNEKFILKHINRIDKKVFKDLKIFDNITSLDIINSNISNRMESIYLPYDIPGRDHQIIRIQFTCKFEDYSDSTLISFLNYDVFEYCLEFSYSNLENEGYSKKVNVELNDNNLNAGLKEKLEQLGRADLLTR